MKRIFRLSRTIFLLCVTASVAFAQEATPIIEQVPATPSTGAPTADVAPKNMVMVNPLVFLQGAQRSVVIAEHGDRSGVVMLEAEYQRAFTDYFGLSAIPMVQFSDVGFGVGAAIGLNAYPFGEGLRGLIVSIQPHFSYTDETGGVTFQMGGSLMGGWQWLFDAYLAMGLSVGVAVSYIDVIPAEGYKALIEPDLTVGPVIRYTIGAAF